MWRPRWLFGDQALIKMGFETRRLGWYNMGKLSGCRVILAIFVALLGERLSSAGEPRTFLLELENLEFAKKAYKAGNPVVVSDVQRLVGYANRSLTTGPFSVMNTPEIAPSGDPHDLVSYGFYWWPNPDTPDGLPWVYRDGFGNRANEVDWKQFTDLGNTVRGLSLAYYFTDDEKYADRAATLLRTFFLDEETYMNPRILYSDVVPGISPGSFGVPGIANIMAQHLFDGAGILEKSPAWTAADKKGLQDWSVKFIEWAESSHAGKVQRDEPSNHGTSYDFLMTLFGLYAEREDLAENAYNNFVFDRMPGQIAADGSNPLEMKRANNLLYHRYNLSRAIDIAALGRNLTDDVDLFNYETDDGRGLRMQVDYIVPYMTRQETWDKWPGFNFGPESQLIYYAFLRRAAVEYHDPKLLELAQQMGDTAVLFMDLTHPEQMVYRDYSPGDANLDGVFDSVDLIKVFQGGMFETTNRAYWSSGDWNGDRRFNSSDLVAALQAGKYKFASTAVPEPATGGVLVVALIATVIRARRRRFFPADASK